MNKTNYSEGDNIENKFLKAFKEKDKEELESMLESGFWNYKYHLSPTRQNILNWYDFKKGSKILEVGAGMGAVTGAFLDKGLTVHSLELEERRADILEARWGDKENFKVIRGNLLDYKTEEKYDYVISIGVLEYAGTFVEGQDPYLNFVNVLKSLLNDEGEIIVAIENKYGLKYWAGAPEDHTARYFDSLENYPLQKNIQTFSKKEITKLFKSADLNNIFFYYPMPDYKFPEEIFSQDYQPTLKHNIIPHLLSNAHVNNRVFLMDERRVFDGLIENDQFEFFSNSFLIIAKK